MKGSMRSGLTASNKIQVAPRVPQTPHLRMTKRRTRGRGCQNLLDIKRSDLTTFRHSQSHSIAFFFLLWVWKRRRSIWRIERCNPAEVDNSRSGSLSGKVDWTDCVDYLEFEQSDRLSPNSASKRDSCLDSVTSTHPSCCQLDLTMELG
jgi:hypothetical protein